MRSSLRLLELISFNLRGFATKTSCPKVANKRAIQGECVPTSMAIRVDGMAPNLCANPLSVVAVVPSCITSPAAFSTQ
jgi:hypothetical protein